MPLVFAGGEDDQVARVRNLLPDATYVSWAGVVGGLKRARRLEKPVVPGTMEAYSQTELEPKLLVDFKVAAIDQTWSGLRFARKKR